MAGIFSGILGLDSAIKTLMSGLNSAFGDIWCVAIFVLVDVVSPYAVRFLDSAGLYQGIGANIFTNFLLVLKFTLCDQWKKQMGIIGGYTH